MRAARSSSGHLRFSASPLRHPLSALSNAACALLRELPRISDVVFPSSRGGGPMPKLAKHWTRISKLADLPADISPHVLRHSFANRGAAWSQVADCYVAIRQNR